MKCDRCGKEINNHRGRLCPECDEILTKQVMTKLENGNNDILQVLAKNNIVLDENYKIVNTGNITDGYHTFDELYFHRLILFSIICKQNKSKSWKSKLHHNGTMYKDYFIVGINTKYGQYTYHYHIKYWDYFKDVHEILTAPEWDGHKPKDIERLLSLL